MANKITFTIDKTTLASIMADRHREIFAGSAVNVKITGANGREIKDAHIEVSAELD